MKPVSDMSSDELMDRIMYSQVPTVTILERGEYRAEILCRIAPPSVSGETAHAPDKTCVICHRPASDLFHSPYSARNYHAFNPGPEPAPLSGEGGERAKWAVFRDEDGILHVMPIDHNNHDVPEAGHSLGSCCLCNPKFVKNGVLVHECLTA